MATTLFVGWIEIDDGGRHLLFDGSGDIVSHQAGIEASHQPVMDGLTLGQNPDPKRRIEIVHTLKDPLVEVRRIKEERMHAAALRRPDDAFDIDLDLLGIEMDCEPAGNKSAISCILKGGAKFANDLAQGGACLFLIRPAPQQADQPFAAFVFRLGERKIAENGAGLLGSQFDRPALESDGKTPHQRHRKARSASRRGRGLACSQPLNARSLLHPPIPIRFAVRTIYIKATPPV